MITFFFFFAQPPTEDVSLPWDDKDKNYASVSTLAPVIAAGDPSFFLACFFMAVNRVVAGRTARDHCIAGRGLCVH